MISQQAARIGSSALPASLMADRTFRSYRRFPKKVLDAMVIFRTERSRTTYEAGFTASTG